MIQHELFGTVPPERIAAAHAAAAHADYEAAAHAMIAKTVADAEMALIYGPEPTWTERALAHVEHYAAMHKGFECMAEDIRMAAVGDLADPPDQRAWGAVIRSALRKGLIHKTDQFRLDLHGSPKPVYRC